MKTKIVTMLLVLATTLTASAANNIYVAKYNGDRECAISYTFDDGLLDHYLLVFPYFEKLGIEGTFWLNGAAIEDRDEEAKHERSRITWEMAREMAEAGQEMSNHSWSHPQLREMSMEDVRLEIERNDSAILEHTGIEPKTFCYPFNGKNPAITKIAMEGRVGTRLTQKPIGGVKNGSTDESLEEWLQGAIDGGAWESAMIHGITEGFDYFTEPDILWRHLDRAVSLSDRVVWIATFCDVASYIAERDDLDLKISIEGRTTKITPTSTLDAELFVEPLTMVVKDAHKIKVKQGGERLRTYMRGGDHLFDFDPHGEEIAIQRSRR